MEKDCDSYFSRFELLRIRLFFFGVNGVIWPYQLLPYAEFALFPVGRGAIGASWRTMRGASNCNEGVLRLEGHDIGISLGPELLCILSY
jgi:hypothetical protein